MNLLAIQLAVDNCKEHRTKHTSNFRRLCCAYIPIMHKGHLLAEKKHTRNIHSTSQYYLKYSNFPPSMNSTTELTRVCCSTFLDISVHFSSAINNSMYDDVVLLG
jgi:hypothetical protein